MTKRPHSDKTNLSQTTPENEATQQIFVRDAAAGQDHEESLTAFMVSPKYLSPKPMRNAQPKRPLNASRNPDKVKMYSQIGALDAAYRIRRPRTAIPVVDISSRTEQLHQKYEASATKVRAFSLAAFASVLSAAKGAQEYISNKARALFNVGSRVKYSALSGAAIRKFGMPQALFRTGAALAVLLLVFGIGTLSGWFGKGSDGSGGGNGGVNGSGGNAVIEVRPSSDRDSGQSSTSSPQSTSTPGGMGSTGNGMQSTSGTVQGSVPVVGGGAVPITPGRGSGDAAASQAPALPPASAGDDTSSSTPPSGGSGGDGGDAGNVGDIVDTVTNPPLPVVDTGECPCSTIQGVTNTATTTVEATKETLGDV
ncbi:MAG: hypothetical protein JWP13_25 [Candidatus Saccharibacteria bacterium]|nr:hypothetical protein [Candidatus Saccharibacteria bacterium]